MRFYRWDQSLSTSQTDEILWEVAGVLVRRLSKEATCEAFAKLVSSKDVRGISDWSLVYDGLTIEDARVIRQIIAFFAKRSDVDLGCNRRDSAVNTYLMAERLCAETNDILRKRRDGRVLFRPSVERVIFRAQHKISSILGDVPRVGDLRLRFGPGATTTLPRRMASPRAKLSDVLSCSEGFCEILDEVFSEIPHLSSESDGSKRLVCVTPARLDFVPKTAKTDRSIAVEPVLNQMVQLGIGDVIARRLRRFGIDIRDQTANQRAALRGSRTGALATLDLSSASDTIAHGLVLELLPIDWFLLLDQARSAKIEYKGFQFEQEKFCSMGNGFTFPLETLLFYAIAVSCCSTSEEESEVLAYGDDLVVPTAVFPLLTEVLAALGFLVNTSKSFSSGPFRESCGCDYYSGIAIRPLYIKGPLHGFDAFRLYNFFIEQFDEESARVILSYIDPSLRLWGPAGYGCGHLVGEHVCRPKGRKRGWSGYTFETYTFRAREDFRPRPRDRVLPLYSTYIREGADTVGKLSPEGFFLAEPLGALHSKEGILGTVVPGTKGYNRITVYTLEKTGL